jgi:hypothetical protein
MGEKKFKLESMEDSDEKDFKKRMPKEFIKSPLKEEKNHEQKKSSFNDGVTINFTVSPRKVFKWTFVILILFSVFFLGRYSVGESSGTVVNVPDVEVNMADVEDGSVSKVGGFFKSLFAGSDPTGAVVVETETNSVEEIVEVEELVVEEEVEEPVIEDPVVEEESEQIMTSYSNIAISFKDVSIDWKETWGKIKSFKYTVTNSEPGTIEPDHFAILVEGYGDFEKLIPVPKSSQSLKAGTIASSYATVPGGFSYNELTTGDLSGVDITLVMYDASGKEMALVKKSVDLSG